MGAVFVSEDAQEGARAFAEKRAAGLEGPLTLPLSAGRRLDVRMDTATTLVFVAVVGARFLLPLAIPYYPLPAIVACLILDGVDQTIFQAFGHDPPGYQAYDKAMDVFYLSMAYLATLRNWESMPAFRIGWFLYFYRLVGALAFELTHARWLLLVFPNVFEYFFIAYETIRSRWAPVHLLVGWWLSAAAPDLGGRQAAAGVLAARRPARRHRADRRAPLDHRAAHRRGARARAGLPEAGAAAAVAAGLVLEVPARAAPGGDRRAGGAGRPGGCGTTRSSPPAPSRRSCSSAWSR